MIGHMSASVDEILDMLEGTGAFDKSEYNGLTREQKKEIVLENLKDMEKQGLIEEDKDRNG